MRLLRRALGALGLAALFAAAARVRGKGGTPPQHGGWQPIDPDGSLADTSPFTSSEAGSAAGNR